MLNIFRTKFFQAIILCFLRPDSGHFGNKILSLNRKIWYFAVQTDFTPNFVRRDPLIWVDGSLDNQRTTFENWQAELPAPPAPIKNVNLNMLTTLYFDRKRINSIFQLTAEMLILIWRSKCSTLSYPWNTELK